MLDFITNDYRLIVGGISTVSPHPTPVACRWRVQKPGQPRLGHSHVHRTERIETTYRAFERHPLLPRPRAKHG